MTSVYTSRWIPGLIDKLEQLAAANVNFRFLFDGQTLVIEDLLEVAPSYEKRVKALVDNGRLLIGPYYCQPDWQLSGGELLIRNLMYGQSDTQQHGGQMKTGWLVDTFGHISQSPQIHSLFGIESVYVWRGVPDLEPYFHWQAPDGSQLLTINLFGGYRNLYGVSHVPEVAARRLNEEVKKLRPFYPTPDIPLFDGYDLEDNPEDPYRFFGGIEGIADDIALHEATPIAFAQTLRGMNLPLPMIAGELNSGKYGAIFPGTLSARTYLKVMARDCEQQLFQLCEPLAVLAWLKGRPYPTPKYEKWSRMLLQNAVHDCLCGVSIDQVHEKMEYSYRQVHDGINQDVQESLAFVLQDFTPGNYAISTNPFAAENWQVVAGEMVKVKTNGIGVWPIQERLSIRPTNEPTNSFHWQNDHYQASISPDGQVQIGDGTFGELIVSAEHGDLYSDETGGQLGVIQPTTPPTVVERSVQHCVVSFKGRWQNESAQVSVTVKLHFDQSPLLCWTVDLDSKGTNLCVEMVFQSGHSGNTFAGMPFDIVQRQTADTDLLPRDLPPEMASVLLGQRELNEVLTSPFHDLVMVAGDGVTTAVLAKGIRAYKADEAGTIKLTLRRSVEWLTAANLENRIGDAGPFFYTPDGRCERQVRHEAAIAIGAFAPDSVELHRLNAAYQNPPLVVRKAGAGTQTNWQILQENLPLSSLTVRDGAVLARFYNVAEGERPLSQSYTQVDVWGDKLAQIATVPAKKIVTVQLEQAAHSGEAAGDVTLLTPLPWRSGPSTSLPDPAIMAGLEEKIAKIKTQIVEINAKMADSPEAERLRLQRQFYVLERERLEFELSHLLNRRKLADNNQLNIAYLYEPDAEIADIGLKLNRLRIKRRIFDYVVQVL